MSANTQTNFPETRQWLTQWELNDLSTDTTFGQTLDEREFTISPV